MKKYTGKEKLRRVLSYLHTFVLFFIVISFVITCSFLLFLHPMELNEEEIRRMAPVVFYNIFLLSGLLTVIDFFRRWLTMERPVREIQRTLQRLMDGDFTARAKVHVTSGADAQLIDIADSVNRLADELGGVETLRTDFIANVSHELKTPLAVMQNYSTMLQQPGLPADKQLEYACAITATSRRLASLITNILKLNKLENQQIFPAAEEYDLGEQLCECLLQFEEAWEQKELNIETEIEDGVRIRSDAELLSLVWNNLISNAVKFTPNGGTISLRLQSEGENVTVCIADTGCGMTPEVGAHIFEKFYQGDSSHASQGNGLGLALVKRVMDILHGEIRVESARGVGSTFTVTFRRR